MWIHVGACTCVSVCGLTAGQVRVGLKPCALCQGCTGAFFRIDELPAFLIKPSVIYQQNKNSEREKKKRRVEGRRGNVWEICHLQSHHVQMWCAEALTFITRILKTNSHLFCSPQSFDNSGSFEKVSSFHPIPNLLLFFTAIALIHAKSFCQSGLLFIYWS